MKVGIIGAGMSGLSVAHFLHKKGVDVEIIEAASYIGGFSHSFLWNGHTCDWAAHRLFTHDEHILQTIQNLTPLRTLNRVSAVYMGGRWLKDPVDAIQLCLRFFPENILSIPWTYLNRNKELAEDSFKNYCLARFGRRLEEFLFSPYTEKMFGIPSDRISVEWARKKVRLAGPLDVIKQGSKTKFNYFYYPKNGGYGTICDALLAPVKDRLHLNAKMTGLEFDRDRIISVKYEKDGQPCEMRADHIVSTIPLTHLCRMLGFNPPLTYRAVAAVYAHVNKPQTTPNHWIYYMDGDAAVNRLCEFKNLNPNSGPPETSVVCAEVTDCERPDFQDKAIKDLTASGIFTLDQVLDTTVVRRDYSYPVYCCNYESDVDKAFKHLAQYKNLHSLGRAAQFEHMEIDDCLEAALQFVRELTLPDTGMRVEQRSDLAVEPRVGIVIADTGDQAALVSCVNSFRSADYSQRDILVVTSDETRQETLAAALEPIPVLCEKTARGLAGLFNKGMVRAIKEQCADFVLLIQGHTHAETDLISQLIRIAQRDPESGILSPQIRLAEKPDCIWSIGLQFRKMPPSTKNIGRGQPVDKFKLSREVDFAVSSGMLVSRGAIEKAGLFDPGFSCYYEDMDFSKRVRDKGFRIRYVPEAKLYHHESAAPEPASFYEAWGESFIRFYRRHMTPLWVRLPVHFVYLITRETLSGRASKVPALCRGAWKGLHRRLGRTPDLNSTDGLG